MLWPVRVVAKTTDNVICHGVTPAALKVVGELFRTLNAGPRFEEQYLTPRNLVDSEFRQAVATQTLSEFARLGVCSL